jgi:hypothetical protein
MRIPEDARPQQLEVLAQLRLGVEPRARVVEVDVAAGVEARILAAAELGELRRLCTSGRAGAGVPQ